MGSQNTDQSSSSLPLLFLALTCALLVLSAFQLQHKDTDIFWALKSGEWILANGVPRTDPFSYTFAGREWVDFTWGFQVIAHLFFTYLGGWAGLFVLQVIVTGATFALIYLNIRMVCPGRLWLAGLLVLAVLACSYTRVFVRPHIFGYLFISAYFLLLNRYERDGSVWCLAALFPLQALWVNIHSSAVLGVFILGAYAAGGVVDALVRPPAGGGARFDKGLLRLVAASFVVPLASLINPYGAKLALFPFIHQAADKSDALKHIGEWVRIPFKDLFFYFYPDPVSFFSFRVLAVLVVVAIALNFRRVRARDLIILAGAVYMAVSHVRWTSLFAYFAVALIAANLGAYLDARRQASVGEGYAGHAGRAGHGSAERAWMWAATALAIVIAVFLTAEYAGARARENYGLGIKGGAFPEGTVEFLNRQGIKGNIYNEYIFGGYIIYNYRHARVFIDGRTPTVYSPYFYWTTRLIDDPVRWGRLVDDYAIDMALIKLNTGHCGKLWADPEWRPVYFDDVAALFLKRTPGHEPHIKKWGLERLNPCADAVKYELPEDQAGLEALRAEIKGFMTEDRGGGRYARAHRLLGIVDSELGGELKEEAVRELATAAAIKNDRFTSYDLGLALAKLGRHADAAAAFKTAAGLHKGYKEALLALALSRYELGDYAEAIEALDEYFSYADDASVHMAYRTQGKAYFKLGRYGEALPYLKRAAYTAEENADIANASYYAGNALFELGELDAGAKYYARAIEADPGYKDALRELARGFQAQGRIEASTILKPLLN